MSLHQINSLVCNVDREACLLESEALDLWSWLLLLPSSSIFPHIYLQVSLSHPLHTNTHLIKTSLYSSFSCGYSIIKIYHFLPPYGYNRISSRLWWLFVQHLSHHSPRNSFLGEETKLHLLLQWSSWENETIQHITASIQWSHMLPLEKG